LIWLGLAGLLLSGVVLHPNLARPLVQLKMALVLIVSVKGVNAGLLGRRLESADWAALPRRLAIRSTLTTVISQVGWWGATMIGFLSTH